MNIQEVKQRFGIIGNSTLLNRAIEVALQVAPTDLTVLISGESGSGKEVFSQIIHQYSARKHGKYIAVNCGAIPEGTIDSELFGHEKGAFTGALSDRKGYFEVADKGTIFLDEVGELPLSTQVRLLRVLETGEFIKVGSSKVLKTNVRVVTATNVNLPQAIQDGKFREDLYYRLNTVPVNIRPLRERKEDIHLLFRKFALDFAERYKMPPIRLDDQAQYVLESFGWPGNVRQLKNITEQISIIEGNRIITEEVLKSYLPSYIAPQNQLPAVYKGVDEETFNNEREILYKILFDMRKDMTDLKKLVFDMLNENKSNITVHDDNARIIRNLVQDQDIKLQEQSNKPVPQPINNFQIDNHHGAEIQDTEEFIEESLSLEDKEIELIKKALEKHHNKRKAAAKELGISERTLYRKIKEHNIK